MPSARLASPGRIVEAGDEDDASEDDEEDGEDDDDGGAAGLLRPASAAAWEYARGAGPLFQARRLNNAPAYKRKPAQNRPAAGPAPGASHAARRVTGAGALAAGLFDREAQDELLGLFLPGLICVVAIFFAFFVNQTLCCATGCCKAPGAAPVVMTSKATSDPLYNV